MNLFDARSLWPSRERTPVVRLGFALVAAPAVIAALFSVLGFFVAGMTEQTGEAVWRVTGETAATLSALVFLFTLTFGLAGIAFLWSQGWRSAVAWALTGGAVGAIAGVLFCLLAMSGVQQMLVVTFALAGWALFLLIRGMAGVRDAPARA